MAFENSIPAPNILSAEQYSLDTARQSMPNVDKAVQSSDNKVKLQSDVMALQDQKSDQSDQQKLTTAMSSVNPNSPNYADDVLKAATAGGMSGKGLLNLQQNLYVQQGNALKIQQQKLQISDTVGKMSDDQMARVGNIVDGFHSHLEPLVNDWDSLGAKQNDPTQKALFASRRDASIREFQDQVNDYVQKGVIDPKTAQTMLAPMLKEIGTPYNPELTQQEYDKSSAFKAAMDAKKQQVALNKEVAQTGEAVSATNKNNAEAAGAGRQVVTGQETVTNPDGSISTKPKVYVVDKATGGAVDTGVNAVPKGTAGASGGRDAVMNSRMINAGEEIQGDLHNLMKLDIGSNAGWLSGKSDGGGVMSSVKSGLANKMTTQQTQTYNVEIAGIQRNLSAIEASGLAPAGSLTHAMDAVVVQPGDTSETAMRKMAQIRQITENGMKNILNKDDVNDAQKKEVQGIIDGIQKAVPFTQDDIDGWKSSKKKGESFNDYMTAQKDTTPPSSGWGQASVVP
jgi:hypothetical protein